MPGLSSCTSLGQPCRRALLSTVTSHTSPFCRESSRHRTTAQQGHMQARDQARPANTIDNKFWDEQAHFTICADGGANRMLDAIPDEQDVSKLRADIIAGDLDSIRPDVQHIFEGLGSQVIDLSDDQDTTDLQKCLSQLEQHFSAEQLASATVVAAGGLGGRLDHTLNALSTLHKWRHLHIILWGDGSTAQLLSPGKHIIKPAKGFEGPTCGLVPLNGPATLTTKGLKWNMSKPHYAATILQLCATTLSCASERIQRCFDDAVSNGAHFVVACSTMAQIAFDAAAGTRSEFTGLISTSNSIVDETVEVETNADVIWITEVVS